MKEITDYLETLVFLLYCAIPFSLLFAFVLQNGAIFMNTVFGFAFIYFAYGLFVQYQNEEA